MGEVLYPAFFPNGPLHANRGYNAKLNELIFPGAFQALGPGAPLSDL